MYDRFTDRARKVMLLANEEARRLKHEYIGTEHILLGLLLLKDGGGVAGVVLKHLGLDLDAVRREVETVLIEGPDLVRARKLLQTPSAGKVIEYAMAEAHSLGHYYVGTEHLLLGLLRHEEGFAAMVLTKFGVTLPAVLATIQSMLRPSQGQPPAAPPMRQAAESIPPPPIVQEERPPRFDPAIFQRFTPRAYLVMQLANHEAQRFNHEFIGTEHLLLALINEGSGVAAEVLKSLGLDLRKLRWAVEKWVPGGLDMVTVNKLPRTPRATTVIMRAVAEADALGHEQVDTAHLLLALLTEPEGLAAQILLQLGHSAEAIREITLRLSAENPPREGPTP